MLLRDALGETLRQARTRQNRTLREVSTVANVSLGYLSEIERGRKEASSELLASICDALELELSDVLDTASHTLRHTPLAVAAAAPVGAVPGEVTASSAAEAQAGTDLRIVMPYRPRSSTPSVV